MDVLAQEWNAVFLYDRYEILGYNTVTEKSVIFFKIMRPIEIELCINFSCKTGKKCFTEIFLKNQQSFCF